MEAKWLINPDYANLEASVALAKKYGAAFEYNDFFYQEVYTSEEEVEKHMQSYFELNRDRGQDMLHGVFMDIVTTSRDEYIRDYARKRMEESVLIAERMELKGVVFHTGLIGGLRLDSYVEHWVTEMAVFLRTLLKKHPSVCICMENSFETSPDELLMLMNRTWDCERLKLCLDYGHAALSKTPVDEWFCKCSERLGHIHLNDNDLINDLHMAPGTGAIDFTKFKMLYEKYGKNVPILLEVTGSDKQEKALSFMKKL